MVTITSNPCSFFSIYRKKDPRLLEFENLYLPFGGKLRSDNRWILLAKKYREI